MRLDLVRLVGSLIVVLGAAVGRRAAARGLLTGLLVTWTATAVQPAYAQGCGPFAISFDLTQLSAVNFNIDGAGGGETAALVTLSLPSGTHNLEVPSSSHSTVVPFTVSCLGTLDFDPALESYVNGRGTSTLTIWGFPVTLDLTRLSAANEASPCAPLPGVCAAVFGPHLIANPTVRRTGLRDSRPRDDVLDRWGTRGVFSLHDGQRIDPDTEVVEYVLSQNNGANQSTELYHPVLTPAECPNGKCFVPRTNSQGFDRRWRFGRKRTEPDIAGAPGWRSGDFRRTLALPNLIKFTLSGKHASVGTPQKLNGVRRVRQSIKIGDDCITRLLDCAPNVLGGYFTCKEAHCGNGTVEPRERCGEPTLPNCAAGRVCDTCQCVLSGP